MLAKITLAVAILAVSTQTLLAQETVKCKGVEIKINGHEKENMMACAASVGITDKASMTPDKIGCMAKCILEKKLLVDHVGKPHKENILKFVESAIPDSLKAELTAEVAKCLDTHGIKIDPKEASCSTYTPLATCLHAIWTDFCK